MTKTGDKFTAEERALLINNGVVDAKTLNDLSGQKETLEQSDQGEPANGG